MSGPPKPEVFADTIRAIWLPIAFAAGLVFLLQPAVKAFERLRIPRVVGTLLAFLILLALILATVALVLPTGLVQSSELAENLCEFPYQFSMLGYWRWISMDWHSDCCFIGQAMEERCHEIHS